LPLLDPSIIPFDSCPMAQRPNLPRIDRWPLPCPGNRVRRLVRLSAQGRPRVVRRNVAPLWSAFGLLAKTLVCSHPRKCSPCLRHSLGNNTFRPHACTLRPAMSSLPCRNQGKQAGASTYHCFVCSFACYLQSVRSSALR